MATYLLIWNPNFSVFDDSYTLAEMRQQVQRKGGLNSQWSTGITKKMKPGDRLFLVRQTQPPLGIMASGSATGKSYNDEHWDRERADNGDRANYVKLKWDALLDPDGDALLPVEKLAVGPFRDFHWPLRASGVSVNPQQAEAIEKAWAAHLRRMGYRTGSGTQEASTVPLPGADKPQKTNLNSRTNLNDWENLLDVVNCANSVEDVDHMKAYFCPNIGRAYSHRRAKYFGPYASKRVATIHEIRALVVVGIKRRSATVRWKNVPDTDELLERRALAAIRNSDEPLPAQVFLLGNGFKTDFTMSSSRGMFASKKYFWGIARGCQNAQALAKKLKGRTWEEFGYRSETAEQRSDAEIQSRSRAAGTLQHIFPDEIDPSQVYPEGAKQQVIVNRYERNPKARRTCIAHWGCECKVCGFDFRSVYGDLGEGFIHVHHLVSLTTVGKEYEVDPVNDLRPVCPNCHAMLHRDEPPLTIGRLKARIRQGRQD